jgi:hypothetical protein
MSYDGMYRLFTAEEARADAELQAARADVQRLIERVADDELGRELEAAVSWAYSTAERALHARLCRLLPHLTDLLALACFPADMPTPELLGPGGAPEPVMEPDGAHERHYGFLWERRHAPPPPPRGDA